MTVSEPATMLTDYALAIAGAYFAVALYRRASGRNIGVWIAAFLAIAIAALAGGSAHGFRTYLGAAWIIVWRITAFSIAIGAALSIVAGIWSAIHPETRDADARRLGHRRLKQAIAISLAGIAVLIMKLSPHPHFNHNDLYHVIQIAGLFCLYRGAVLLNTPGIPNPD